MKDKELLDWVNDLLSVDGLCSSQSVGQSIIRISSVIQITLLSIFCQYHDCTINVLMFWAHNAQFGLKYYIHLSCTYTMTGYVLEQWLLFSSPLLGRFWVPLSLLSNQCWVLLTWEHGSYCMKLMLTCICCQDLKFMELRHVCASYMPSWYVAWEPRDSFFCTQHSISSSDEGVKYTCILDLISR
jgi:hypothetical protein